MARLSGAMALAGARQQVADAKYTLALELALAGDLEMVFLSFPAMAFRFRLNF